MEKSISSSMVKESSFGKMEPSTKVTGGMGGLMALELSTIRMETSTLVSSRETKRMDSVYTHIARASNTSENGKTTRGMVMVSKSSRMAPNTPAISKEAKKWDMESS
jgi:hypothetical protein